MTLEINRIFPKENLILLSLDCIVNGSDVSDKSEHNWNTVFLGKINDMKLFLLSISRLLDESLWLSVATPVKKFLPCASVKWRNMPFK